MPVTATILAGDEFANPVDFPTNRLDDSGASSLFNNVGSVEILSESGSYVGSAVALSENWVLTAGHNVDLHSNGAVSADTSWVFHLPGFGSYAASVSALHTDFTGFGNPVVNDDLALLFVADGLPSDLSYWGIGSAGIGDEVSLVGFGRSGFGSYGYTSDANLVDRRIGYNVIDSLELDDEGSGLAEIFTYDFDAPTSPNSLGNDRESVIGPGDSGGGAFIENLDGSLTLVGINTFTEGSGGLFGDTGGGILVSPYLPWIRETTGLYQVPEPSSALLFTTSLILYCFKRSRF